MQKVHSTNMIFKKFWKEEPLPNLANVFKNKIFTKSTKAWEKQAVTRNSTRNKK